MGVWGKLDVGSGPCMMPWDELEAWIWSWRCSFSTSSWAICKLCLPSCFFSLAQICAIFSRWFNLSSSAPVCCSCSVTAWNPARMSCLLPFEAGVHDVVECSGPVDFSGVLTWVEEEDEVSQVEMWGLLSSHGDSIPKDKPMSGLDDMNGELRAGVALSPES